MADIGKKQESMRKGEGCFVCGAANAGGMKVSFSYQPDDKRAMSRMIIPERYQGWEGVVHGGILATLLDEACAHACRLEGEHPVTAELMVRYRKPVPVATEVVLRGEVVSRRRRLLEARAVLEIGGEVHAEADAKVILLDLTEAGKGDGA